jgi:hypothetical protein
MYNDTYYGEDGGGSGSALDSILQSVTALGTAAIYQSASSPSVNVPYANNLQPLNSYGQPLPTTSTTNYMGIILLVLLLLGGYFVITRAK